MQGKEANEDSQQNQEKLDLNGSGENRLLCGMWLSSYWCGEAKPEISVAVIKGHRRSLNYITEIIGRKWQFAAARMAGNAVRQACMMIRLRSAEPCDEVV